ncbi:fumarylacetoacetate hydrolase family protein [Ottowia sp.]|uniref:fumarylacetoacetate hydrolase family protein n=1 Tax=Ottowia sp. TaxID=1898956 RepID=UPI0039E3B391
MTAPAARWRPAGTVYGPLLNARREHALWAPKMAEPPYKAAPQAPVLYVKTANTFAPDGAAVAVPDAAWIGPTLGLVIGDSASNQPPAPASQAPAAIENIVSACVLLNDLSLPHASYYRPAIRFRNRDGFLVCGAQPVPAGDVDLGALKIEARVNGALAQTLDLATLVRDAATLLADVNAFMTLRPGDVLMLGTDCLDDGSRPLVRPGDQVEIRAAGFAPLCHTVVGESSDAGPPQGARAPSGGSAGAAATSVGARSS